MEAIITMVTANAITASFCFADSFTNPSKNRPNRPPYVNVAIASPSSTTDWSALRDACKNDKNTSPHQGKPPRQSQGSFLRQLRRANVSIQIEHCGGRQGIERGRKRAHCRSDNAGQYESRNPGRQTVDYEARVHFIRRVSPNSSIEAPPKCAQSIKPSNRKMANWTITQDPHYR